MTTEYREVSARCVTPGPGHFWFGYYDKIPWDATGRYLLAMRSEFADRAPTGEEPITLGTIDLRNDDRFEPFAETRAWCWQQGCMLQWMPQAPDRLVLYNAREPDRFVTVFHDLKSGSRRVIPRSTYCVSPDGRTGVSINHARLAITRPGYGYPGLKDPFSDELVPDKDGVYRMDLETGEANLIVSVAQAAAMLPHPNMNGVKHWFNHLQFNTDGTRFVFFHRYARNEEIGFLTRMFTAGPDGSNLYLLNSNRMTSHFDWRDTRHILAYARVPGTTIEKPDQQYVLFHDRTTEFEILGRGVLTTAFWSDGHCSYSPDRRWILNDSYPDKATNRRTLMLYNPREDRRIDIGRFLSPPEYGADRRCDLHPRWSRDGRQVCFDSVHEGKRSIYVADVSDIVTPA